MDRRQRSVTTLLVLATANGKAGPLGGPFTLSLDAGGEDPAALDLIDALIGFVRAVAAGVSCYNRTAPDESSNLNSYACECFEELQAEAPTTAALLENLRIDCSRLPQSVKDQPIWKLDRAILRTLPGAAFID
jgi:hypothetical protein